MTQCENCQKSGNQSFANQQQLRQVMANPAFKNGDIQSLVKSGVLPYVKSLDSKPLKDYYIYKFMNSSYYYKALGMIGGGYRPGFSTLVQRATSTSNKVLLYLLPFNAMANGGNGKLLAVAALPGTNLYATYIFERNAAFISITDLNGHATQIDMWNTHGIGDISTNCGQLGRDCDIIDCMKCLIYAEMGSAAFWVTALLASELALGITSVLMLGCLSLCADFNGGNPTGGLYAIPSVQS